MPSPASSPLTSRVKQTPSTPPRQQKKSATKSNRVPTDALVVTPLCSDAVERADKNAPIITPPLPTPKKVPSPRTPPPARRFLRATLEPHAPIIQGRISEAKRIYNGLQVFLQDVAPYVVDSEVEKESGERVGRAILHLDTIGTGVSNFLKAQGFHTWDASPPKPEDLERTVQVANANLNRSPIWRMYVHPLNEDAAGVVFDSAPAESRALLRRIVEEHFPTSLEEQRTAYESVMAEMETNIMLAFCEPGSRPEDCKGLRWGMLQALSLALGEGDLMVNTEAQANLSPKARIHLLARRMLREDANTLRDHCTFLRRNFTERGRTNQAVGNQQVLEACVRRFAAALPLAFTPREIEDLLELSRWHRAEHVFEELQAPIEESWLEVVTRLEETKSRLFPDGMDLSSPAIKTAYAQFEAAQALAADALETILREPTILTRCYARVLSRREDRQRLDQIDQMVHQAEQGVEQFRRNRSRGDSRQPDQA